VTILLDTQCWLWWIAHPERLGRRALEHMIDPGNRLLLSAASSWEIAVKYALGKLSLPAPPGTFVPSRLARDAISALPVEHAHALQVGLLPHHHRDPFDRLLVAQAQIEAVPLMTADRQLEPYEVDIIWADGTTEGPIR
jgi:PIN domain nuclease of toxin-antitoxin system